MISNPSAAPVPVRLSDGQVVIVTPLTAQDVMAVLQFGRQRELQLMLSAIPRDADEQTRKMMTQTAFTESRNFDVNSASFWNDTEVIQMVLYFSLRHAHTDMKPEKASKLTENAADWNTLLSALNGETAEPSDVSADEEKKTA